MKSEQEIRRAIERLRQVIYAKCDCPPGTHQCEVGRDMAIAQRVGLMWVVEDVPDDEYQMQFAGLNDG